MNLTLKIWRQKGPSVKGKLVTYEVSDISTDMSFLEMLDVLNEKLILDGDDPVAFDHDCREGICGMCGVMINGKAHGGLQTTTCQLHMRSFKDGDTIVIEPWRSRAFPLIKDLAVDRRSFDRIIQAGGYISAPTGTRCRCRRRTPTPRSTPPPASAAAPAWRPARTARRCCSPPPRSPTSGSCRRASPSATSG
jgi:succinate dehydrogenase / fumarate reductase iron-sulfur subunit